MSRSVRRSIPEPRMEMAPLLDVIFLLLTFFIYSLVLTVRADVMPIELPALSSAEAAEQADIAAITVGPAGDLFLNRQRVSPQQLRAKLESLAQQPDPPSVFVAPDARQGKVDRMPVLLNLLDMLRNVGIEDFHIVGRGRESAEQTNPPAGADQ